MLIDGIPITGADLTVGGLYILLMLLLFFERVVPIGRVKAEQETTKYWRDTAEKKDETIAKQAETIHILVEGTGKTVEKVMTTIQDKAGVDS